MYLRYRYIYFEAITLPHPLRSQSLARQALSRNSSHVGGTFARVLLYTKPGQDCKYNLQLADFLPPMGRDARGTIASPFRARS